VTREELINNIKEGGIISKVDLSGMDITGADFSGAELESSVFEKAICLAATRRTFLSY
jgi:uncharacterized protein YjbI with pentapeptide repeats